MNTPNKITVLRLIFAILMIAVFSLSFLPQASSFAPEIVIASFHIGFNWIDVVCFTLFILGSITDAIDGHIARSKNLITNLGKFMDPLADKFLVDGAFILLCTRMDWSMHHQVLTLLLVLFVGRDLAVDGLRFMAASKGKVMAAQIWGKVKTAAQMGLIPVLFLNGFPFSLLNFTNGLDSWMNTRWEYTYIVTNILVFLVLAVSIYSAILYFKDNKSLLKEEEN